MSLSLSAAAVVRSAVQRPAKWVRRGNERTQAGETVRGGESGGDERANGLPHRVHVQRRDVDDIVEERRPASCQDIEHASGVVGQFELTPVGCIPILAQPLPDLGMLAQKECHRRCGNETRRIDRINRRCRQPCPTDLASEAQHVEQLRFVTIHA